MNKTRQYGQEYWYIQLIGGNKPVTARSWDYRHECDNTNYSLGNYFATREAAEDAIRKTRELWQSL